MTILGIIILLWWGRILLNIFSYAHLWYIKEYRFDRMRIHLRTRQGSFWLFPAIRIPPLSPKAIVLCGASIASVIGFYWTFSTVAPVVRLGIIDLLLFPFTWILVGLMQVPTQWYHGMVIWRAVRKLRSHAPLQVVGITGSYGKTSTKEFLAAILSSKYHVLKTAASQNSPIGIAEVVLGDLSPQDTMFVVEMGAYKKGEIARMAAMVHPSVAVLTAINEQHQDLFGSIETTMQAKYELVEALPRGATVICNADNTFTRTMGNWAVRDGKKVWWFGQTKPAEAKKEELFLVRDVQTSLAGITFWCVRGTRRYKVSAPVVGAYQAGNIAAAIAAATACGMDFADAAAAASGIVPVRKVMEVIAGPHGVTYINDTFNNNPDAAEAALRFLETTKGKKYLVFQPMIELGGFAQSAHERVGALAGTICTDIILTNGNFYEAIKTGVGTSLPLSHLHVLSARPAATLLRKITKAGDTVLFKGKEAESVLRALVRETL